MRSFLNLLKEKENRLKIIALEKLYLLVDVHWAEISENLADLYYFNHYAIYI